jgi:hypothetical protein
LILLTVLLLGLPLVGVMLAGHNALDYLEFPPRTQTVEHAPFSWAAFIGLTLFILATVLPFIIRVLKNRNVCPKKRAVRQFPWWGWAGLLFGVVAWLLAWTRFDWFAPFQRYTFTLPWIAYIVVINALTFRRAGCCLLTHRTKYFLRLFPLSAAFWWFFEYLNRFVQNWYYVGIDALTPLQYALFATLPFSTVLPAVLGTEDLLATFPRVTAGLDRARPLRIPFPRVAAAATLLAASAGLAAINLRPDLLFPLLWVAPFVLITALQTLRGRPTLFAPLRHGDWSRVIRLALAALICGFFWELWNVRSAAKWIYAVPYVQRFHLFEMPLLGYAGYLPFGLECAVIGDAVRSWLDRRRRGAPTATIAGTTPAGKEHAP